MIPALALLLAVVFAALAALHLWWAAGGQWGARASVPSTEAGTPVFSPGPAACVVVALGLAAAGYVCLAGVGLVPPFVSARVTRVLLWVGFALFALRTLGDFRYVGLTRRIKGTEFARRDRMIYTPLCGLLGLGIFALARAGGAGI